MLICSVWVVKRPSVFMTYDGRNGLVYRLFYLASSCKILVTFIFSLYLADCLSLGVLKQVFVKYNVRNAFFHYLLKLVPSCSILVVFMFSLK